MKKDLWICERKAHLPEHDGATGYFYYVPIEPFMEPDRFTNAEVDAIVTEAFKCPDGLDCSGDGWGCVGEGLCNPNQFKT